MSTKTATDWLRAVLDSKPAGVDLSPTMANRLLAEFDAAHRIAYGAARADIETKCAPAHEDGREERTEEDIRESWYDLRQIRDPEGDAHFVSAALEYLDGRGLIKRHPEKAHWVRVMDVNQGRTE